METTTNTQPTQETREWVTQVIRSMDARTSILTNKAIAAPNGTPTAFRLGQVAGIHETITTLLNALNQE